VEAVKTKLCPRCGEEQLIENFDRNKARPDGRQVYCKGCRNGTKKPVERPKNGTVSQVHVPTWDQEGVTEAVLLRHRKKFIAIIESATFALERIESKLSVRTRKKTSRRFVADREEAPDAIDWLEDDEFGCEAI